ncbi:MAG: hypothetical protein MUO77_01050 [Anaerolineales bacterium]|nr:hypothetical protein [Anaerolineales bacterium]
MKYNRVIVISSFILVVIFYAGSVSAQSPLYLREVQPPEGQAGETLELTLLGFFDKVQDLRVEIEGVEVLEVQVESEELIHARIFIPESAAPGSRPVVVTGFLGPNEPVSTTLEAGFHVFEAIPDTSPTEPPILEHPTPVRVEPIPLPPQAAPDWLLILIVGIIILVVGGALVVIILAVTLRRASLKKGWQSQAQTQELPETCQHSAHITRREKIEFKPGRWKVNGLKVTLYNPANRERSKPREVPKDLVQKIDKAARQRLMHGESDDLKDMVTEIARETTALITAWQSFSEKGKSILLEIHLEGGSAKAKFVRYRCVQGQWRNELEWKPTLKAVDHLQATFRAPMDDEPTKGYQVFLEGQLKTYFTMVVEEAARLL